MTRVYMSLCVVVAIVKIYIIIFFPALLFKYIYFMYSTHKTLKHLFPQELITDLILKTKFHIQAMLN